uniref:Uncharacterized protein n=1 Tax=Knipowitschia caucasica TaxID=637954 RepID=A0AAV2MIK4_KNICA
MEVQMTHCVRHSWSYLLFILPVSEVLPPNNMALKHVSVLLLLVLVCLDLSTAKEKGNKKGKKKGKQVYCPS